MIEIPHEVGDFAILVQSGFTKYQAILAQYCTHHSLLIEDCSLLSVRSLEPSLALQFSTTLDLERILVR